MAEPSFWERLGRGVGYGWQKAKEVGAHVGEHAEQRVAVVEAKRQLGIAYERLGKWVIETLETTSPSEDLLSSLPLAGAAALLDDVKRAQRALEEAQAALSHELSEGGDAPGDTPSGSATDSESKPGEDDPPTGS